MGGVASRIKSACGVPAPSTRVSITYSAAGGEATTEDYDFLVVACDPRDVNIGDRTEFEEEVNKSLTSHTFHTSLFLGERPNREESVPDGLPSNGPPQTNYAVRFNPAVLEDNNGGLYAFRDEVMARDAEFQPSPTKTTWTVSYQVDNIPLIGRDRQVARDKYNSRRDKEIKENVWIDWNAKTSLAEKELTVDYFAHFLQEGLKSHLPWKIVEEQGKNKTLYIASFTCFESVLHCYLYQNMLMASQEVQNKFPRNKNSRIAVIGAGASGILFASQHLVAKGYTNFKIFESTERYGGKTLTEYQPIPGKDAQSVPCELGACYLSPAYFPLYSLIERYNAGEVVALDRGSNAFRSVIDPDIAENQQEHDDGVEFTAWSGYRKNGYPDAQTGEKAILRAGVLYVLYHVCAMGMDPEDALPRKVPSVMNVVSNLLSITKWIVKNLDDISDVGETFSISSLLKGALNSANLTVDDGMKEDCDAFQEMVDKSEVGIDLQDLVRLFSVNLFNYTFAEFLEALDVAALIPTLVYAYQVQGYGTLSTIPAYYGLVWITPGVFLNQVLAVILPPEAGSKRASRGSVNILSQGWLNVWKTIVERDLQPDHFEYNASISAIDRKLPSRE